MRYSSFFRHFVRRVSYVQGQSHSPRTREYFYFIDHQGQLFLDDTKVKNFITCFKDKKFLEFFFKRVKLNTSGRYEGDFPYISPCGRETNYIHCDDLPIVFSHLLDSQGQVVQDVTSFGESSSYALNHSSSDDSLNHSTSYNGVSTDQKTNEFVPRKEVQSTVEGHTPHLPLSLAYGGTLTLTVPFQPDSLCMLPASGRIYHRGPEKLGGVGLIKSSLAIELSQFFVYEEGAGEGSHPRGFHWQEKRWSLDSSLLPRLTQLTRNTS